MLKVAVPNKGALSEEALRIIREAGYQCRRSSGELMIRDFENDLEFYFLRPRDIAVYVGNGILDLGITGRDLALDSDAKVAELMALNFGRSAFYYAVPRESVLTPEKFFDLKIATSYPNIVAKDLALRNISSHIIRLDGAVEISIRLGVADVVADVVQSGKTLEQAGLKTIGGPILKSEAVLVGRTREVLEKPEVENFADRIRGIIVARDFVMVEYDAPESMLSEVCAVTPGIESPTIAPLSKKGWVAVKAMARRQDVNRIMDRLSRLGAKGIIVTDIRTCRI